MSRCLHPLYYLLLGVFFYYSYLPVYAQDYVTDITHYTVENGLSNRFVNDIYQDTKGFLWIATDNGVNRFDGKDFQIFNWSKEELGSNKIYAINEDVNGNLWLKSRNEKLRFHWVTLITKDLKLFSVKDWFGLEIPFTPNEIIDIKSINKILFLLLKNGDTYKYDGSFKKILFTNNENERKFICGLDQSTKTISYMTRNSLYSLDTLGNILNHQQFHFTDFYFRKNEQNTNLIWPVESFLSDQTQILIKTKNDKKFRPLLSKDDSLINKNIKTETPLYGANICNDGNIYFFNSNHILSYNTEGDFLFDLGPAITRKIGTTIHSRKIYTDRNNRIWIGSEDGLLNINHSKSPFRQELISDAKVSTRGILELTENEIIINSYRGIIKLNIKTGEQEKINDFYNSWQLTKLNEHKFLATSSGVKSIYLMNAKGKVLDTLKSDIGDTQHLLPIQNENRENIIYYKTFLDSKGTLWLGSSYGLWYLDKSSNTFKSYGLGKPSFQKLLNSIVWHIEEKTDDLFLGTSNGFFTIDKAKTQCQFHSSTSDININHFYQEDKNIFWLATTEDGLVHWNKETNEKQVYSIKDGLSSNNINAVYSDKLGHLWLPSYNGLIRFNKKTKKSKVFWDSDGLSHNEFNRASHYQSSDGTLYFGGLNGINIFHPSEVTKNRIDDSPLRITSYQELDGQSGELIDKTAEIIKTKEIELIPQIKSFIIRFSLLNFDNSTSNKYAYKIEGIDTDWNYLDENYIRINQLPYGEYVLKIKGQTYRGAWSNQELAIPLKLIPPFYMQTAWRFLGLGLLGLLVYLFFKGRLIYSEKERIKLENVVKERTAIIEQQKEDLQSLSATKDRLYALIAHDLRDPVEAFKGIVGKINFLIKKDKPERVLKLANYVEESADNLSNLLENLLGWAQQQRGELLFRPSQHQVKSLIQEVFKNLNLFADTKNIKLEYIGNTDAEIFGDYQMLSTIFRNITHNAIKFSYPNSVVTIECVNKKAYAYIRIKDSGIGVSKEKIKRIFQFKTEGSTAGTLGEKGTGLGLALCKDLVKKHSGEIKVESVENEGTSFIIFFPFEDNQLLS